MPGCPGAPRGGTNRRYLSITIAICTSANPATSTASRELREVQGMERRDRIVQPT
jgi:hypothetical protein